MSATAKRERWTDGKHDRPYEEYFTPLITASSVDYLEALYALPNIGAALCSIPQSVGDAQPCSSAAKTRKPLKLVGVPITLGIGPHF